MRSESKNRADDDDDDDEKMRSDAKETTSSSSSRSEHKSRHLNADDGAKDGIATGEDEAGAALVQKVITYFFDDDAFARVFEVFAEENCGVFDPESDEMKLEYTEIYNRFQALFESKLEGMVSLTVAAISPPEFIASQGATVADLYRAIRAAYARDRESSLVLCSEILVATADFDVFVLMMKQTKEAAQLAKQ